MKNKKRNSIAKYLLVIFIVVTLPIVINFILLIPTLSPIVGDNTVWLSFWGSYLGAVISASVALGILHIQRNDNDHQNSVNRQANHNENENNRKLQLNIMKYQQQSHWLDNFREVSLEYCNALNSNDLILISNIMWENPHDAFNIVKQLFDNIDIAKTKFAFKRKQDDKSQELANYIGEKVVVYKHSLNDLQWLVLFLKSRNVMAYRTKVNFIQYLQSHTDEKADINNILQLAKAQTEYVENSWIYFNNVFLSIYAGLDEICPSRCSK